MYAQSPKNPILIVIAFLAIVALTSLACSFNPVRLGSFSPVVDITLTQDVFDRASLTGIQSRWHRNFHTDGTFEHLLDEIKRVELHDGYIRFIGENGLVDGSFDLSLTAEDGILKAEVIAVNIPGIELGDEIVAEANHELEHAFTDMVADPDAEVVFKEVAVEEGELRMKVQVNVEGVSIPEIKIEID